MLDSIDHIIIAVKDISVASDNYTKLLGFPPTWKGIHSGQGTENALFPLENLYVELLAANGEGPGSTMIKSFLELNGEGLSGIALGTSDIEEAKRKLTLMKKLTTGLLIKNKKQLNFKRKVGKTVKTKLLLLLQRLSLGLLKNSLINNNVR